LTGVEVYFGQRVAIFCGEIHP